VVRGQRHAPAALYPRKDPAPIVREAGWAPGPVWIGVENLALTGIRSPDRPARSYSLYWLSYPTHETCRSITIFNILLINIYCAFVGLDNKELKCLSLSQYPVPYIQSAANWMYAYFRKYLLPQREFKKEYPYHSTCITCFTSVSPTFQYGDSVLICDQYLVNKLLLIKVSVTAFSQLLTFYQFTTLILLSNTTKEN
jgi:hypothetical protein